MPDFPITPQLPVKRSDLEYPTEDVNFPYLAIINKLFFEYDESSEPAIFTLDSFTDKAIKTWGLTRSSDYVWGRMMARRVDMNNKYFVQLMDNQSTKDFILFKMVDGTVTELGYEAVDLNTNTFYPEKLSLLGSNIKAYRTDMDTPKISVTDTDLASGRFGFTLYARGYISVVFEATYLLAPSSPSPQVNVIVEYDVIGEGTIENPIKPNMPQELVEVSKDQVTPEEWLAIQSNSKGEHGLPLIDRLSVTWGSVDYKGEPTMLCAIYSSSPSYLREDRILKHIEYAKKKNLMVIKIPRTLREVNEIHKKITGTRREMMITVNELAYHLLGKPELEIDAVADFYERELLDLNRIKKVPTWELHRILNRWEELGKHYKRFNAIKKLAKVRRH